MPSFSFEVEYAKSGRAACKKCKAKIENKSVRIGFKAEVPEDAEGAAAHMGCSWHHFGCFASAKGAKWFKTHLTPEVAQSVPGLDALKDDDRQAVETLFKACRGECAAPDAPQLEALPADLETPAKDSKKRKSAGASDGESAAKISKVALTDEQKAAIEEAKSKIKSKNAAWLGAVLAKNGLAKSGRKEDLVERVAENQVLGVPPMCNLCEKKKLTWTRATGLFSCPGYFDDESKSFKRCKGPTPDAELTRTPWEELA